MPAPLISREEVLDRLTAAFREHGYDGATLAELSEATGLGKSSLYHYFPGGKEEMAQAVLGCAIAWLQEHALAPLAAAGLPHQRLQRMLVALDGLYAGGRSACLLGNLVVGGARRVFQRQLKAVFSDWIDRLARLAVEAGIPRAEARMRAEDTVLRIEGALILARGLDDPKPFQRMLRRIPEMLLGPPS